MTPTEVKAIPASATFRVHLVEPFVRHLPGARAHVRQDYGRTICELIDEGVETCWRVDIDLRHLTAKEVRQRPTRLIFGVEVEQLDRNRVFLEPLRQAGHHTGLADPAFSAHRKNHAFLGGRNWRRRRFRNRFHAFILTLYSLRGFKKGKSHRTPVLLGR
jgi:hypothetical protein